MSTDRSTSKEFTAEDAEGFAEVTEFFVCDLWVILCSLCG